MRGSRTDDQKDHIGIHRLTRRHPGMGPQAPGVRHKFQIFFLTSAHGTHYKFYFIFCPCQCLRNSRYRPDLTSPATGKMQNRQDKLFIT